ncbi:MAG: 30S ribosomal protein S12 methylthiotransferase RimO [Spirochaetaceae bacterium]|nr:30S ribosomal protein S12 methylthiotransferase RimO [Spirochaetaceae bacterium]
MKFYLEPLGCVKNQVDAENIIARLNSEGAEFSENPDEADLIIVNSCGFIEDAKKESINTVISFRKDYPDKKIILSGCLARRYEKELKLELNETDAVFGSEKLDDITTLAFNLTGTTRTTPTHEAAADRTKLFSLPGSAYIKIAEGCNNHCSFCAIPLIRGRLCSRSVDDIVNECRTLLKRDIIELCLVAQDLASYGADTGESLAALLRAISTLEGDFWVRLLYLHPDHFPLEILDIIAGDKRFLPYFDIPFQHASPTLLRAMNRRGGADEYLNLIEHIRTTLPDSVIRSTFLTGFPGETDTDFNILLDFQNAAMMDWLGVFIFSREDGVPAYTLKARPSKKTAGERKQTLEIRQTPITEKRIERFIGRRMRALVEEYVDDFYIARLFCQAPEVDGAAVIESARDLPLGAFVEGEIIGRAGFDLRMRVT